MECWWISRLRADGNLSDPQPRPGLWSDEKTRWPQEKSVHLRPERIADIIVFCADVPAAFTTTQRPAEKKTNKEQAGVENGAES